MSAIIPMSWFVFLFFIVAFKRVLGDYDPPKISLDRYWDEKSEGWITITEENPAPENFIIKGTEDYSINNIDNVLLVCRARYPIYWVMTDVKPLHIDEIGTSFTVMMDVDGVELVDIESKEFISYLEIFNDASFTGLYTCRSVETAGVNASTYLYLPGLANQTKSFVLGGHEVEVGQNGQNNSVVIPCKVTDKNAVASLAKKDENETWVALNTSFYPSVGFSLHKDEVSQIIGHYKCSVGAEELIVNVHEEYHDDREFPIKNDTDGVAMWGPRKYGDGVQCCSNSTVAPKMLVVACENMPECDMKQLALMHLMPKVTSKTRGIKRTSGKWKSDSPCIFTIGYIFVKPFLIQCKGDGIDVSGQYATELISPAYRRITYVPSVSINETSYNIETAIKTVVKRWENITTGSFSFPGFVYLDLSKDELYSGEKFVIDCCGMHYYHAFGRIQRIVWKNGTVTTLTTPEDLDTQKYPYAKDFCYTYGYDAENEDYLVIANENMSYFECIVPRWYDKKPGIKRIPLTFIRVPKEPVITSSEEILNVTYHENQLGLLQLECKLSDGIPSPQMVWTKDGYKLNQTDIGWSVVKDDQSNNTGTNLLFMRATKEIAGEYECIAENQFGVAQKTFIVKIIPRSYIDYWIALVVFGGFFVLIACCALRISTLEKQIPSKQVEPATVR